MESCDFWGLQSHTKDPFIGSLNVLTLRFQVKKPFPEWRWEQKHNESHNRLQPKKLKCLMVKYDVLELSDRHHSKRFKQVPAVQLKVLGVFVRPTMKVKLMTKIACVRGRNKKGRMEVSALWLTRTIGGETREEEAGWEEEARLDPPPSRRSRAEWPRLSISSSSVSHKITRVKSQSNTWDPRAQHSSHVHCCGVWREASGWEVMRHRYVCVSVGACVCEWNSPLLAFTFYPWLQRSRSRIWVIIFKRFHINRKQQMIPQSATMTRAAFPWPQQLCKT